MMDVHVFRDAGLLGAYAVAYEVIRQSFGTKQGLIGRKTRFWRRQRTTPRLGLVVPQMVGNLAGNILNFLPNCNIREFYEWLDSAIILQ